MHVPLIELQAAPRIELHDNDDITVDRNIRGLTAYRALQAQLKNLREEGYTLRCKLNSKLEVLLNEVERIKNSGEVPVPPVKEEPGLSYRQLQFELKSLRGDGFDVRCKLNAKKHVLKAEYERLLNEQQARLEKHNRLMAEREAELTDWTEPYGLELSIGGMTSDEEKEQLLELF